MKILIPMILDPGIGEISIRIPLLLHHGSGGLELQKNRNGNMETYYYYIITLPNLIIIGHYGNHENRMLQTYECH